MKQSKLALTNNFLLFYVVRIKIMPDLFMPYRSYRYVRIYTRFYIFSVHSRILHLLQLTVVPFPRDSVAAFVHSRHTFLSS
jgi:hypothetical protein